jgi:hypothetical protein
MKTIEVPFSTLLGKVFVDVYVSDDRMFFVVSDVEVYVMYHEWDCCEDVRIDDICGDLTDLIGSAIVCAEEASSKDHNGDAVFAESEESFTWTYYKLDTVKGGVSIKWYGESNGYYSEEVGLYLICK